MSRIPHVELQADVTTATMLFTMVEALEAAKAPLQHVYFSQGIKYYVRAPELRNHCSWAAVPFPS